MRARSFELTEVCNAVSPLAGAAAGQNQRAGLLLRIRADDGIAGVGEASPLPNYSPDTLDECVRQLSAMDVVALPGFDARALAEPNRVLDWIERSLAASGLAAPAARFALETALLDALGRETGIALAALIGGESAAHVRLPLSALVSDLGAARAAYARGVRAFKLKISHAGFDAGLALARMLREEFGQAVTLRFDANRGLDAATAMQRLAALAEVAPEIVEEPVATEQLGTMNGAPVALALDESLAVPGAWPALAAVCRAVVLKPTLLGGIGACLRIAREAADRGMGVTVTHTFDGPVALAAAAELACALPGRVLACGLDRHAGLQAWPAISIPQLNECDVGSAGLPGLGLQEITW